MARILVVDDDPVDREILKYILIHDGHDLHFAEDGAQALALYQKRPFDLVVTDLMMPNLNGLRLIKELVAMNEDVKIIAVSGKSAEQLLRAEDYGAIGLLRKPIARDALIELVNATLG